MHNMFLVAHNPEYIQHMKDKQKAIINHTAGNEEESEVDDMKPLVSKHYYNDVFVTEFNLYFGYPRSDSCCVCDRIRSELQNDDEDNAANLRSELNNHLDAAAKGYDGLKKDI